MSEENETKPKLEAVVLNIPEGKYDSVQSIFDDALGDIDEMKCVVITGFTKEGFDFMYSTRMDGMGMLWLSEKMREIAMRRNKNE